MTNGAIVVAWTQYKVTLVMTCLTVGLGAFWLTRHHLTQEEVVLERNVLSGAVIFTVGDVGAQFLTAPRSRPSSGYAKSPPWRSSSSSLRLDRQRLFISTLLGAVWLGVANPAVYTTVEDAFPGSATWGRVLLKMVLSCSVLSTAGNWITMFIRRWVKHVCGMCFRKGYAAGGTLGDDDDHDHDETKDHDGTRHVWHMLVLRFRQTVASCNRDFYEVVKDDLKIWPLYDILCYAVIPPYIRPITTAVMASLWSIYMSIASASAGDSPARNVWKRRPRSGTQSTVSSGNVAEEDDDGSDDGALCSENAHAHPL